MLPEHLWQEELLEDLKSGRSLIMKFLLPIVILSPLLLPNVPVFVRGALLSIMILFIGTFGAAVGLVRLAESKMLERVAVLPISAPRLVADYIVANASLDGLQLLIPLVLITALGHPQVIALPWIALYFVLALIVANTIGVLVALISRSSEEVHLFAAITILVVGGVSLAAIMIPSSPAAFQFASTFSPFKGLADGLLYAWNVTTSAPAAVSVLASILLFGVTLAFSHRLFVPR